MNNQISAFALGQITGDTHTMMGTNKEGVGIDVGIDERIFLYPPSSSSLAA